MLNDLTISKEYYKFKFKLFSGSYKIARFLKMWDFIYLFFFN